MLHHTRAIHTPSVSEHCEQCKVVHGQRPGTQVMGLHFLNKVSHWYQTGCFDIPVFSCHGCLLEDKQKLECGVVMYHQLYMFFMYKNPNFRYFYNNKRGIQYLNRSFQYFAGF